MENREKDKMRQSNISQDKSKLNEPSSRQSGSIGSSGLDSGSKSGSVGSSDKSWSDKSSKQ